MEDAANVISLLTDFGTEDEYVGVMKGVILGTNPNVRIVDVSHRVEAQNTLRAAYMIQSYCNYFPKGTVHVIVVDPGVGTDRAIIAAETEDYVFLAPDNGVLTLIADGIVRTVRVENREYFLDKVSQTFHGRDIFSPVAAHVSAGIDIAELGPEMDPGDMASLDIEQPCILNNELTGRIVSVDHFGNLITNIDMEILNRFYGGGTQKKLTTVLNGKTTRGLADSYGQIETGNPLNIIGSRDLLEISVNMGRASDYFKAGVEDTIRICRETGAL